MVNTVANGSFDGGKNAVADKPWSGAIALDGPQPTFVISFDRFSEFFGSDRFPLIH